MTFVSTHALVRRAGDLYEQVLGPEIVKLSPEELPRYFSRNSTAVSATLNMLESFAQHFSGISNNLLYIGYNNSWQYFKPGNTYLTPGLRPGDTADWLSRAHQRGGYSRSRVYLGQHDTVRLFLDVTPEEQRHDIFYILAIDVQRGGIINFITTNQSWFIIYDLAVLVFSLMLGKFFTRKIIQPIYNLSNGASHIAKGNFSSRVDDTGSDEIGFLAGSINIMAASVEEQIRFVQQRADTMEVMNRIDKAVLSAVSKDDLLTRVITIVTSMLEHTAAVIILRNETDSGYISLFMEEARQRGILHHGNVIEDSTLGVPLLKALQNNFTETVSQQPLRVCTLLSRFAHQTIRSMLNVPISIGGTYRGSLLLIREKELPFTAYEKRAAQMIADQVGITLNSVKAIEDKEALYLGIMLSLTSAIDAKSRWTAGHSERVARLSEIFGMELGFDKERLRNVTMSAVLHDIGKIGVPEFILDKPGKLSEEEYIQIMAHPARGAEIIRSIPSSNLIVPGVYHHHEHWDGQGYPGFEEIAFQAASGSLCPPARSKYGWHIIEVLERYEPGPRELAEVEGTIQSILLNQKKNKAISAWVQQKLETADITDLPE
jgi:HD-GYP domain-containing protein (c-di-GMP phosphodiesterase class II)